jgi:hypothetical protein
MIAAFFCLSMTSASAEIYKCRTPDGNLFVTDQEATLPKNCQMVEVPSGDSTFNIVPETKVVDVEPSSVEPKRLHLALHKSRARPGPLCRTIETLSVNVIIQA